MRAHRTAATPKLGRRIAVIDEVQKLPALLDQVDDALREGIDDMKAA